MENKKTKIWDLLSQFAAGELSDSKHSEVKQRINENPEFSREWDYYQTVIKGIESASEKEFEDSLRTLQKEELAKIRRKGRIRKIGFLAIAASIGLLIVGFIINSSVPSKLDTASDETQLNMESRDQDLLGSTGSNRDITILLKKAIIRDNEIIDIQEKQSIIHLRAMETESIPYQFDRDTLQILAKEIEDLSAKSLQWIVIEKSGVERHYIYIRGLWFSFEEEKKSGNLQQVVDPIILNLIDKIN